MIPYQIFKLPYDHAMKIIIEHHYLHRKCPCSFSFGLFDNENCIGVIIYGTPSSAPLRSGICGPEEKDNVIELTRLWIKDGTPKNTESWFISHTIHKVNKEIVVSFADPTVGHVGGIYQATNWIYTGLSAKRTDWTIKGVGLHGQTLGDKYTSKEIRDKFGDAFALKPRPQKHRYIYFNCDRRRKRELMSKLKYPISQYPKVRLEYV